jgi:tryptophan halogenase
MELFREAAVVEHYDQGLFGPPSWLAVYLGQGMKPGRIDTRVESYSSTKIADSLRALAAGLKQQADSLPSHREAIQRGVRGVPVPASLSLYGGRNG